MSDVIHQIEIKISTLIKQFLSLKKSLQNYHDFSDSGDFQEGETLSFWFC